MATLSLAPFPGLAARGAHGAAAEPTSAAAVRRLDGARGLPALRAWLDGAWGMIFSHPQDFEQPGFERDRWLVVLSQEFRTAGVRPLACPRDGARADAGWISAVTGEVPEVALEGAVADLAARQLRAEILGLGTRFVLAVDGQLRRRATLTYRHAPLQLSPIDLLASTIAVRERAAERRAA